MSIKKTLRSIVYLTGTILAAFAVGYLLQPISGYSGIPCPNDKCSSELCIDGFNGTLCDIDSNQSCNTINCSGGGGSGPVSEEN